MFPERGVRACVSVAGLWLCVAAGACGGDEESCPNDLPAACVAPAPHYANDIAPIFARTCQQCHAPGEAVPNKPLVAYADIYAHRREVLTQIYACKMPPADSDVALTVDERALLLAWLVCGAPGS